MASAQPVESSRKASPPPLIQRLPLSLRRLAFNLFPCYRGSGARVVRMTRDWREVDVELPLGWRTRNYVGSIFGGSMFAAVDPFYMVMLINILGPDYVVWDKSASIRFRRPARTTLHAAFRVTDAEVELIRGALRTEPKLERTYVIELKDADGTVHAVVEKLIHFKLKAAPAVPAAAG